MSRSLAPAGFGHLAEEGVAPQRAVSAGVLWPLDDMLRGGLSLTHATAVVAALAACGDQWRRQLLDKGFLTVSATLGLQTCELDDSSAAAAYASRDLVRGMQDEKAVRCLSGEPAAVHARVGAADSSVLMCAVELLHEKGCARAGTMC